MRIAICDDEPISLQITSSLVERWSAESGNPVEVFAFDNGDALLAKSSVLRMDLVFLDIIMPLLSGMSTAKELRECDCNARIVFLTASSAFALESYDVKVSGYLLKPITYDQIKKLLDECWNDLAYEPENFVLKTSAGYQKVYFRNIEFIEAQNKKVCIYLRSGSVLEVPEPLHTFESVLLAGNYGFFKCHRSYLVNLSNVSHFSSSRITTGTNKQIPIARGYGKAFQDAYFALRNQKK